MTRAVHDLGGLIVAQLWHTGRAGHSIDRGGKLPLAPSPLAIQGMQHFTSQGLLFRSIWSGNPVGEIKE
ncbi:hypothetical protein [Dyadobacter sandarakinus]|uniref:hypothetical protein n=1 Tax=Dyadobacter sandarakinus TaxID=2747268 RepID=UPI0021D4465A|nr:hypothetical protein [Dyadobacter sandarakinus]